MKLNSKLFKISIISIQVLMIASSLQAVDNVTTANPNDCSKIKYVPKRPDNSVNGGDVDSVKTYSLNNISRGWITFDHIGYKDSSFQGERHVAKMEEGLQFFGYDKEPLTDLAFLPHQDGISQVINTIQAPVRADWHTLNGNGLLFGCSISDATGNKEYNVTKGEGKSLTITGYSLVATIDKIEVRKFEGATVETIGDKKTYQVLYSEPKKCPGQNFTVEITGQTAKIYLNAKKIYEFNIGTVSRGTGLIASYEEHDCNSLSSVLMFNHTVNGIDYLKPDTTATK